MIGAKKLAALAALAALAGLLGCGGGAATGPGSEAGAGAAPPLKLSGPPIVVDLSQPVPACPEPAPPAPAPAPKDQPAFLIQRNHSRPITRVALSGDGRVLMTSGIDSTIRQWDTATGLLVRRILIEGFYQEIVLSESGTMLGYYSPDGTIGGRITISLIDLSSAAPSVPVTQFGQIAISPDGKLFGVALTALTLYDAKGVKQKELDLGLKPGHSALTLASDRAFKRLAVAVAGEVILVDVPGWKIERRFPLPNPHSAMDYAAKIGFLSDGLVLRNTLGAIQIVDDRGAPRFRLPGASYPDFALAGARLWTIEAAQGKVEAWDATTGLSVPFRAADPRSFSRIAASADGSTLALISANDLEGNAIVLQDAVSMAHIRTIEGPPAFITALGVSPDGERFTTGSFIGTLTNWSLSKGELEQASPGGEANAVESISYDGAGAQLAWSSGTYFVRVRDAKTGRALRQWKPHGDQQVIFAGFVQGKTDLVTAARDGSVMRWDLSGLLPPRPPKPATRFEEVAKPAGKVVGTIGRSARRAALSRDGAWLALDDNTGTIGVLDMRTGTVRWDAIVTTLASTNRDRSIAFTTDGSRLLLSGEDLLPNSLKMMRRTPSLRVFDAATGVLQTTVFPETSGPMAALGDTIALGGFRPALLDATTFTNKIPIIPVDREVTAIVPHPKRDLYVMSGDGGSTTIVRADQGSTTAVLVATAGGDFMTATPEGAFLSSLDGSRNVAWAFASPSESFGFDQFASLFDRPDIVKRRLAGEVAASPGFVLRPPRLEIDMGSLTSLGGRAAKEISAQGQVPIVTSDRVSLRAAVASGRRVERVRAFVNGRPAADKLVCAPSANVDLDVPLQGGRNRVSLIAYDADGYASNPQKLDVVSTARDAPRPDLWLLTVGVSRYENLGPEHQLDYADDDARAVAQALAGEVGPSKPFARLHTTTLLDAEVSVESLERAVEGLSAMAPDDLAILFLAGHGVRLPDDKMVFLTSKAAMSGASARSNGVGWDRIQASLNRAKGRVLVLLDACHSGHVSTDLVVANEALAQDLASKGRAGVLVFAAARGSQLSYEVAPGGTGRGGVGTRGLELIDDAPKTLPSSLMGGHGLFTSAVLEAISGGATDRDRSGAVEMAEFIDFVTWRVKSVSGGAQTPWVARREMFGDFVIAPAARQ